MLMIFTTNPFKIICNLRIFNNFEDHLNIGLCAKTNLKNLILSELWLTINCCPKLINRFVIS